MTLLDNPNHWLRVFQDEKPDSIEFLSFIGQGKSAAVFHARTPTGTDVALKIYDADRLAEYGFEVQKTRIERESSLGEHECSSLVKVFQSGELHAANHRLPYVALELVIGSDLRDRVNAGRMPDSDIRRLLKDLVCAARFLDSRGLCHRDIKVDNCRVRTNGELVLLDLGVLRPIGASDLTDAPDDLKTKYFLGTLRYAPPEFLLRREEDTPDAWRAITLYQIGGVLYEMIHGVPLFSHIRGPYAELVQAVLNQQPTVLRQDVGEDLLTLTKSCLVKSPTERLSLVPWDSLLETAERHFSKPPTGRDIASLMRESSDLYANTVETRQAEWRSKTELRNLTLKHAVAFTADGLNLPILSEVKPTSHIGTRTVVLKVPQNLKYRLSHPIWLCCRIRMAEGVFESAQIDGLALYGNLDRLERDGRPQIGGGATKIPQSLSTILDDPQARPLITTIANEPPDEATLSAKVRLWAEGVLEQYFILTTAEWQRLMKEEHDRIGARSWMSERESRLLAIKDGQATRVTVSQR